MEVSKKETRTLGDSETWDDIRETKCTGSTSGGEGGFSFGEVQRREREFQETHCRC